MTPLVSICLPNLNTRAFLEERMATILGQTFKDWELIVSDNYSDDGSWELFQKFRGDPRLLLFQSRRNGMYANWNTCMQKARGEFVYIATSDDTATPTLLERLVAPLQRLPEISLAVCDFEDIDENSKPLNRTRPARTFFGRWLGVSSIRDGKTECLLHACFGGPTWVTMTSVLFRRKLVQDGLWFRTDRGSIADLEWAMRASLASDIAFVPGRLATCHAHLDPPEPCSQRRTTVSRPLVRSHFREAEHRGTRFRLTSRPFGSPKRRLS